MITTYLNIFRDKLARIRKQISNELKQPKKDRKKAHLKKLIKEVRSLEKLLSRENTEYNLYLELKAKYDN